MSTRCWNKVMLIGNVGRDPDLVETESGTSVCTFVVATDRSWQPRGEKEKREETEWHQIVAFNKMAEICQQTLQKGTRVYISGRLKTGKRTGDKGQVFRRTEVVANQMIALDKRKDGQAGPKGTTAESEATVYQAE